MTQSLTIEALSEARPGRKWKARWDWSWPAYRAWFEGRSGTVPPRAACEAALTRHMPELLPTYRQLCTVAGGDDLAARFLSGWCPPAYLGGCSVAARAEGGEVRLVRNYDLSPDLNEGLLLHNAWTGRPVMGMVEFLWGLSDGINGAGLCVALAFGGRGTTAPGFGVTHILRYVLETCATVAEAMQVLRRVPSHMAYNLVLADASGATASVELQPGGGIRLSAHPVATNHQHGPEPADRAAFTRTHERRSHLEGLIAARVPPAALHRHFLEKPLFQSNYRAGFGTLFTVDYDTPGRKLVLHWPGGDWAQDIDRFVEGTRRIAYADEAAAFTGAEAWFPAALPDDAAMAGAFDWAGFGRRIAEHYARGS